MKRYGRFFKALAMLLGLSFAVGLFALMALYGLYQSEMPPLLKAADYQPKLKSKVYAHSGELIAEFGLEERILTDWAELPPLLIQAFISAEDKNFFHHHGLDFVGIISALAQSLLGHRESLRGASTITQQLAKSLLIKSNGYEEATARTLSRKVKEAMLALKLEMHLSKEEILWIYLNEVYLGHSAYGVQAAARNYFQKRLKELTLGEIAILAGLPQAPSRFSPKVNLKASLARQAYVLQRMVADKAISAESRDQALSDNQVLKVFDRENSFRKIAPYFAESIRLSLMSEFGEARLYEEGLHIYTTLNVEHQRHMQNALQQGLIGIDKRQGWSGPILSPKDADERKRAKALIQSINADDLFDMGPDHQLAMVTRFVGDQEGYLLDLGSSSGRLPLAQMSWARARKAEEDYQSSQLRHAAGVLSPGDVVLVKKLSASDEKGLYSLEQEPAIEGAMVSLSPASGYITAMSGGYSFDRSEFNRISQACRQPGSAFKPVVYSAAIALKKYSPATMLLDVPLTFHDGGNESVWKPKNLESGYQGEVTVREAVMRSMNIPALNVMADVGTGNVLAWAKKLGITSALKAELGTAIGSSCVIPLELAQVFSTIANQGIEKQPIYIREISDRHHQRLKYFANKDDVWSRRQDRLDGLLANVIQAPHRVMEVEDAYTTHFLLEQAAKFGTGQRTKVLGRQIAGKTGTTNDSYDAWFVGYSKNLLSLVWVGNDTMQTPLGVYEQGARTAIPLFNDFMKASLEGLPDEAWVMPKSMCHAIIDPTTGLRLLSEQPLSFVAPFRCGEEPALLGTVPNHSIEQAMEMMGGT